MTRAAAAGDAEPDRLAVDLDVVAELDALADVGRLVVDGDAAPP
jgi:hypothetical protein